MATVKVYYDFAGPIRAMFSTYRLSVLFAE